MSVSQGSDDFYAIIPAGGVGTRLWPLSRQARPKFLYDLLGQGRTLIQSTFDRLSGLAGVDHVSISTGQQHVDAVREQLPELDAANIFAEPSPRDSTAAIALATAVLAKRHGDQIVVGSFAADHVIRGRADFIDAVRQAVATARAGYVTTIGIAASRPSTAFGYIHEGPSLAAEIPDAPEAHLVERFVEKPDAATAQAYLSTGEYRWNAGMFVMRADVLLAHLAATRPALAEAIDHIADAIIADDEEFERAVEAVRAARTTGTTQAAGMTQTARATQPAPATDAPQAVSAQPGPQPGTCPTSLDELDAGDFHTHRDAAMSEWWYGIEKIAFDYSVAEPLSVSGGVAMIPGDFGWDDIGDFNSVAALLPSVNERNVKILGDADLVAMLDSAGDVVAPQAGRLVALLGVNDMVVVDTPDALLVAPRARSQEVKNMVKHLSDDGHEDVL
ncbi:mannose-1-phosphate guanylyltransferase [Bifidobacterium gallicum]|uniref:Mannose-1-phosphate guanylyltransferase n=1 Tax=Bifidobacterium gallicum DSM 20093 = LMG 11596 TaxID=561180 RepID=D1NUC6_9BIFI|nr:mannose-1-phosphate guanylyltransferase [Bifidobacterium gallicum]EFA23330.1 putative mannose-1-phosphate guanylyltransferase/mannose-6-phosphate isomerase [Bifidobacterium gallicum DSM 20093 = LMG 11596]KFI57905.1 mannose-1-phosphate guanylyltransferase [Bifidobacterium gallicum DSM 20093 = LMG 11596]